MSSRSISPVFLSRAASTNSSPADFCKFSKKDIVNKVARIQAPFPRYAGRETSSFTTNTRTTGVSLVQRIGERERFDFSVLDTLKVEQPVDPFPVLFSSLRILFSLKRARRTLGRPDSTRVYSSTKYRKRKQSAPFPVAP